MGDISAAFEALFRWMHVFAGILWIGHLYFFNFVNGQFEGKLDGGTKKTVIPELRPRALFWFRWGAAWTWVTGVLLLGIVYYMNGAAVDTNKEFTAGTIVMIAVTFLAVLLYDFLFKSPLAQNIKVASTVAYVLLAIVVVLFATFGNFSYRGTLIHTGAMFGTIMAFNVWFRIWPAQQKNHQGDQGRHRSRCEPRETRRTPIPAEHVPVAPAALGDGGPAHHLLRRREPRDLKQVLLDRLAGAHPHQLAYHLPVLQEGREGLRFLGNVTHLPLIHRGDAENAEKDSAK